MALLPRFLVLESTHLRGRYLSITENAPANVPSGFLKFDGEQVVSPRAKFAVEQAETGNGLVHIRSCYNNKYWAVHGTSSIVASADKPEEDQSKTSCTLFEPVFDGETGVRFRHVQRQLFAIHWLGVIDQHAFQLSSANPLGYVFKAIDWEALVILPPRVSFKSEDGMYLCSRVIERYPYQRFESNLDVGDPLVAKELFVTADGNYRIKDGHFARFWRRSPNWIWADAEDNNNSNAGADPGFNNEGASTLAEGKKKISVKQCKV